MEWWNNEILGLKSHDVCVWVQVLGVNSCDFSVNVPVWARDDDPLMAIIGLINERVSFFDAEKPLEAYNPTSFEYAVSDQNTQWKLIFGVIPL